MNDFLKNILIWLVLAGILMSVFNSFTPKTEVNDLSYSDFILEVQNERVATVINNGSTIEGERVDGSKFTTVIPPAIKDDGLIKDLVNNNVKIVGKLPETPSVFSQLLISAFPILLILAIFMFFMRQMQGGMGGGRGGPMSFGKSKARLIGEDQIKTTFADVAD
mgnify:CR=1 FL=1